MSSGFRLANPYLQIHTQTTEQYLTYVNLSNMQGDIYLYPEILQT